MKDEPLLEKVLHRLVKKHISGTTMSSALDKAKEFNSMNVPASITFLSGEVVDKSKARYITTTYLELIRRISRLGIKASIQIPAEQIGFSIDQESAVSNLEEITAVASRYGVFVWLEVHGTDYKIGDVLAGSRAFGIAFPNGSMEKFIRHYDPKAVKLMFNEDTGKKERDYYKTVIKEVKAVKGINNCILSSLPEKPFWAMVNNGIKKENSIAFEFGLGYSSRKLAKAVKKGAKISITVPFGKDWVDYATTNAPEGYMRFFAKRLLND